MLTSTAALYIHIPYCVTICSYCDFDRQAHGFELIPRYLEAVEQEIGQQPRAELHSVFFGGGTPSLLEPRQVARVLEVVARHFALAAEAETTLEANPDDLTEDQVRGFRTAGVNRLSLGVQSFHDPTLRLLRRRHSSARAEAAVRAAQAAGMANLSLDLMYGLPGLGLARWRHTLERALVLEPDHLSCYLLTLEPSVPMARWVEQGRVSLPRDEAIARQYELARTLLAERGFEHYELSNWARPGRASRHNLTYWRDEPYLGVGAGAASSWQGQRYKNTPHVQTYLRTALAGQPERVEWEQTPAQTRMQDYLALGLRLREGVDPARFEARFGRQLSEVLGAELEVLIAGGPLEWHAGRLRVAEASLLVTNEILARLQAAVANGAPRLLA
ncbi:MAG: radical SAM family heme chaperone HemW [Chloroflexi bacterium]|nr:radical SAM family heme chaperone HemW [Chloroflexota bacterium]